MTDANYFLIGTDGKHHGPLSPDDVKRWLAEGLASRYSRARRETENQWTPLREMPEFEEATRPPYVGGGAPTDVEPEATDDEGRTTSPQKGGAITGLDPLNCFRRSWWLVASDFAVLGGWTLVSAILIIALSLVPGVGGIVAMPVNYLLQASVYALFLARMRGQRPSFRDIGLVIRLSAVQIILAGLAQALIASPVLLTSRFQNNPAMLAALIVLLLPCLYLLVGYVFVLPLIVDKQLSAWRAMELSRKAVHPVWFSVFGLLMAAGMLIFVSALALGFGLVLTLPLCTGALTYAYDDLFNR